MGFKGAVVSDYCAIEELISGCITSSRISCSAAVPRAQGRRRLRPAGRQCLREAAAKRSRRPRHAGRDRPGRAPHAAAEVPGRPVRESVRRCEVRAEAITDNAEARALAPKRRAESVVLLKNDGALPLRADALKTLAVIGPNAAVAQLGGYSNVPTHTRQHARRHPHEARRRVQRRHRRRRAHHRQGRLVRRRSRARRSRRRIASASTRRCRSPKGADAIVLVIGGSGATSREAWADNHLGDATTLDLVGEQNELARAMFALGKPVVVVLINGRPQSVVEVAQKANALLEGWYLGQEGGTAMADVLFGDANPGGKLPVTIAALRRPAADDLQPEAERASRLSVRSRDPLFPFGFGLSYTTFEIGAPKLSASQIAKNGSVKVSVDVRNTGEVAGDEVVQLYLRDVVSSVTRPRQGAARASSA